MSTSIATLGSDVLSRLIGYIDGDDFISLMGTGNRALRQQLTLSCSDLTFPVLCGAKFPFAALRLPKIRSLNVWGVNGAITYLDLSDGGDLLLSLGSKTLQKLKLSFRNSAGLFTTPGRPLPRLLIRDRYPVLTSLTLEDISCDETLEPMLGQLPETLTAFYLDYFQGEKMPKLPLSSLAQLPRHLKSISIRRCILTETKAKSAKSKVSYLPPNLETLELYFLDNPLNAVHMPPTLTSLTAHLEDPSGYVTQASQLPKKLKVLHINSPVILDAPLPSTLETILCEGISKPSGDKLEMSDLPSGMVSGPYTNFVDMHGRTRDSDLQKAYEAFPKLNSAMAYTDYTLPYLPRSITRLVCLESTKLSHPLPESVTDLHITSAVPSKNVKNIPSSLLSLSVRPEFSFYGSKRGAQNAAPAPTWTESAFAEISSRMLLTDLTLEWDSPALGKSLKPLATMETLISLHLNELTREAVETSPQWLPQCLPKRLRELRVACEMNIDGISSDSFLSGCKLSEAVPHLEILAINLPSMFTSILIGDSFATLPKKLLSLDLEFMSSSVLPNAFSKLPRTLKAFTFISRCVSMHEHGYLTNKHFEGMPPALSELRMEPGPVVDFDLKIFKVLPTSLVSIVFEEDHDDTMDLLRKLNARARKIISERELTKGFLKNR